MSSQTKVCAFAVLLATCPLLLGQEQEKQQEKQQERPYSPLEGMDKSGRIPKKDLPVKLKHPERWRYFPEARLKKGNLFERFMVSTFFTPILFREEDVGTGGGVAITDIDFRNQRRREFANIILTGTDEGQQTYSFNWRRWPNHVELPGGGVIQDERTYWTGQAGYRKTLTTRYFGRGSRSLETAETSYTNEVTGLGLGYQFTEPDPADNLILGIGMWLQHTNLHKGRVKTVDSTEVRFPAEFAAGDNHDILWVTASAAYDTRDSLHNPYQGWNLGVSVAAAPAQTGGDVGAVFGAHGSKVFILPPLFHHGGEGEEEHPPTDVLAIGASTNWTTGDLPFYWLPSLGGSHTLRGYIGNRFTDRASWHASAEYRFWFVPRGVALTDQIRVERIGAALFYDVGTVASSWDNLRDVRVHDSYGLGLRISLERTALFRFDYGISDEDKILNINFGLTF